MLRSDRGCERQVAVSTFAPTMVSCVRETHVMDMSMMEKMGVGSPFYQWASQEAEGKLAYCISSDRSAGLAPCRRKTALLGFWNVKKKSRVMVVLNKESLKCSFFPRSWSSWETVCHNQRMAWIYPWSSKWHLVGCTTMGPPDILDNWITLTCMVCAAAQLL